MDLVIGTAVAAVTLSVMTAILLSRSVPLTLAAFSVAPFMVASNWFFARRIHQRTLESKQVDTDLTSFIQQAVATVGLAQAFRREPHEFGRFQGWVGRSIRALLRLNWQEQLYPLARDAILAVSGAIIFGYGGYLVYRDQFAAPAAGVAVAGGMTVGTLLIFMDYTRKLWDPLKWLTEFVAKVQFHVAASRRVFAVLDTPTTVRDAPDAVALPLKAAHAPARPGRLRLSRRPDGAAGRLGPDRAGRDGRLRRPERDGQEHAAQPDAPLLRPDGGRAPSRRASTSARCGSPTSGGTWRWSARTTCCCR